MNDKKYKKKLDFQNKMISHQSEQIDRLKLQVEKLELECRKKDEIINSVSFLKDELSKNISDVKKYKDDYKELINELKKMKEIMNQTTYKGRWRLVRFLVR